ncbi:MAG: hypothetical protein QNJ68_18890 [Microcoleaceae cyanobacterium MO_207.B10]|nr:hypothetical protein [Microcoleaceae cyanobacterium MO_207.B10]
MKLIPILSLALLFLSYTILGWTLATSDASLFIYCLVIAAIILLDSVLTVPLPSFKRLVIPWFKSDICTFIFIIFSAFLFVVFIRWIHILMNALVLISPAILTRLDLQTTYGLKRLLCFLILVIISEASLGFGVALYFFFK